MKIHALERFWGKVAIGAPDECWPWQASTMGQGYPAFSYKGGMIFGHRVARFGLGPLLYESKICACHTCDNPVCCNPNHLFIATAAGNRLDHVLKGRVPSRYAHHKGTPDAQKV